jgi:indole-3-glycerol phosphate synthase
MSSRSVLDTIVARKKEEVAVLQRDRSMFRDTGTVPKRRDFLSALSAGATLAIIAEVKKASPSKGIIRHDFDPVKIAHAYRQAGANAVSVITDETFFMGSTAFLTAIREAITLPVLRKDFIIDMVQIEQTVALGADAMLLIVAALDSLQLRDFYQASRELGIEPLVEVHSGQELDRAMRLEPSLIGINNRNLSTFTTDINVTLDLMPHIPATVVVVSESGIENREQALALKKSGVKALLVGELLMRQDDPTELLHALKAET